MKGFSRRLFWFLLVAILCLSSWLRPVNASVPDSRLIQLEFEVSALRSQINQIQNQLARTPGAAVESRPVRPLSQASALPGDLPPDVQFDNLATLVIEINQRVMAIEERLLDTSRR